MYFYLLHIDSNSATTLTHGPFTSSPACFVPKPLPTLTTHQAGGYGREGLQAPARG